MSQNEYFDENRHQITKKVADGLRIIKANYELRERPIKDCFKSITVMDIEYNIAQYEIVGVGNLFVALSVASSEKQMDTFIITPYFKNLPIFCSLYSYSGNERYISNEIYSQIDQHDEYYDTFVKRFADVRDKYTKLPDIKQKQVWFETDKTVSTTKQVTNEDDQKIIDMFIENLYLFIRMEQGSPLLATEDYKEKWKHIKEFTDSFTDSNLNTGTAFHSQDENLHKEFYDTVLFAPGIYRR